MTDTEAKSLDVIIRCWQFMSERNKGYVLGLAEASADYNIKQMINKKADTSDQDNDTNV